MAEVKIDWSKISEIPMTETSWKKIQLYANKGSDDYPKQAVYCIRLSPPYMIHYGYEDDDRKKDVEFVSPLIYVGSGNSKNRLGNHTKTWLPKLAAVLPNARYEIWIAVPRVRNNQNAYKYFEGFLLHEFEKKSGTWLPLFNKKKQAMNKLHSYDESAFNAIIKHDNRYTWAIWPFHGNLNSIYRQGGS